ncbi:MAG TPA: MurR/RpiR family transcriptional regulator [Actinomycetota bacterium]|nr:MurR/RpiR family transcriptional regulator [Actinomycetota bacterium]
MRKNPDFDAGGPTHTSETIGEEIRERLGEMTPSERRVARTLLATYPTAGLESLPQLAEGSGVTGPTVLRFVRKIGFDGYPDFQRSLRQEVQARTEGLPSLYRTKGGTQDDDVLRQSHEAFTSALDATLTSSSLEQDLAPVVALLADPKRQIWFAGGRFSQFVASYLCLQMRMLRPGCAVVGESPQRRKLDTYEISRRDVVCLFDYRRYQQDTIAAGKVAADHGAVVVVFTDPWLSPAVEHARHVLISHADSASPFDSLLGAFALTEVIAAKVVVALGDRGRTRVAELETVVEGLHDPLATVIDPDARGAEAG